MTRSRGFVYLLLAGSAFTAACQDRSPIATAPSNVAQPTEARSTDGPRPTQPRPYLAVNELQRALLPLAPTIYAVTLN